MVSVYAGCVCVMQTTQAAHATVHWTSSPVWPVMDRSVMVVGPVIVVCVNALTKSFKVPPVRFAPLVLESALNTSECRIQQ